MKKLRLFLFTCVIAVTLSACQNQNPPQVIPRSSDSSAQPATSTNEVESETVTSQYVPYDQGQVAQAATSGKAVLFFHAPWCPTCKAADADITKNSANIPKGVIIFKTDYDTETDLKKKYAITYQHTFVQVDSQGDEITKWNGGGVKEIISNIK